MTWKRRIAPSPSATHWWQGDAANTLCGLVRASGEWVPMPSGTRCSKCEERLDKASDMMSKLIGEELGHPEETTLPKLPPFDLDKALYAITVQQRNLAWEHTTLLRRLLAEALVELDALLPDAEITHRVRAALEVTRL